MTTKKDLVEAHSFSRRRLVTAFVSGAPGGREVEPARPGRTIVGGVAVAVLLVAGAAVASVLSPRASSQWDQRGMVVSKSGARYVVTKDEEPLRPVINLTSAQLILGLSLKPTVVSADTVSGETPGPTIGIAGAPESLPTEGDFVESGWTACTQASGSGGAGIAVAVQQDPDVRGGGRSAFVVASGGTEWLVAEGATPDGAPQAYRYQLPDPAGPVLQAVFGRQVTAAEVPAGWLALFPEGTPIGPGGFRYEPPEPSAIRGSAGMPPDAKSGDLGVFEGQTYLILKDGVLPLDPFQAAVYQNTTNPETHQPPGAPATFGRSPAGSYSRQHLPATAWPTAKPSAGEGAACAQLETAAGKDATVRLATDPGTAAWPDDEPGPADVVQHVDPGKGAFVYTGRGRVTDGQLAWIVDSRGTANQLGTSRTIATLGLADYDAPVVPDTWIKLFGAGVELSTEQALCPPGFADVESAEKDSASCAPGQS